MHERFITTNTSVTAAVVATALSEANINTLYGDRVIHALRFVQANSRGERVTSLALECSECDESGGVLEKLEIQCGATRHIFTAGPGRWEHRTENVKVISSKP